MSFNARYGLEPLDCKRLYQIWSVKVRDDTKWDCFDDFVLWSSIQGYVKGMHLTKRNELEPHSPDNSYFWAAWLEQKTEEEEKPVESRYCQGCTKNCVNSMGCADWQKWFAKNWNENISISKKLKQNVPVKMTWKYEHPDLIREGIIYGC